MNELSVNNVSQTIAEIINSNDPTFLKEKLEQIKAIEAAVKFAKKLKENAIALAKLHAYALIRIVELNYYTNDLHGLELSAAKWLYSLTPKERDLFISKCGEDGLLITTVYKNEVLNKDKIKAAKSEYKIQVQRMFNVLEEEGCIDFGFHTTLFKTYLKEGNCSSQEINDAIQGLRTKLLSSGAVGTGNDLNIYILPEKFKGDSEIILYAIVSRLCSISKDICKVEKLIETSKINKSSILNYEYKDSFMDENRKKYRHYTGRTFFDIILTFAEKYKDINEKIPLSDFFD